MQDQVCLDDVFKSRQGEGDIMNRVAYGCLFLFNAILASASPVSYAWNQFDADSDVLTNGTLVFAVNLGSDMAVTINGVVFEADAVDLFDQGVSVSNGSFYAGGSIGTLSSGATSNLLHTVESNQSTSGNWKYQLTDLNVGMRYTFQMIYSFTNAPGNSMFYSYAVMVGDARRSDWFKTPERILPGVVTGSFVARQPTQDLYVAYGGGNYAVSAAFQLRRESSYTMRENWEHTMAAGSFGVAYITSSGNVMCSDAINEPVSLIDGENVKRILAADVAGSGADELVYVAGEQNKAYYYDFATAQTVSIGGNKIIDITAIRWSKSDSKMTLVINQPNLYTYRNSSWTVLLNTNTPRLLMRGDFVFGDGTDELVYVTSRNEVFIFDSETALHTQRGGQLQFIAVPGDLFYYTGNSSSSGNGDELFLQHSTGWYRTIVDPVQPQNYVALGWSPSETNLLGGTEYIEGVLTNSAACGDVDGYGDRGYTCLGGSIERRSEIFGWESNWAGNNHGFKYVILADIDQNGFDEVYAVRAADETLWYADLSGEAIFKPVGGYPAGTVILVY